VQVAQAAPAVKLTLNDNPNPQGARP
jgi:hypothetical protein